MFAGRSAREPARISHLRVIYMMLIEAKGSRVLIKCLQSERQVQLNVPHCRPFPAMAHEQLKAPDSAKLKDIFLPFVLLLLAEVAGAVKLWRV